MKYIILTTAAIAIGVFGIRRATNDSTEPASVSSGSSSLKSDWMHDLNSALVKAKQSNKPVLVDFHATWCPPCKMMDKQTFPEPTVISELENWIPVKVDVDRNRAVAKEYRISAMPTMVLLSSDGKEIARTEGYLGPSELVAFAAKARKIMSN